MGTRRALLVVAVAALLFGFIWFFERRTLSTDEALSRADQLVDLTEPEISRLECRERGATLWTLVRGNEGWRLETPFAAAADGPLADGMARSLAGLVSDGRLPEPVDRKAIGLDPPLRTLVVEGPRGKRTIAVGREIAGTGSVAVAAFGVEGVHAADPVVLRIARAAAGELQERALFIRDAAEVVRIEAKRGDAPPWAAEKRNGLWWVPGNGGGDDLADPTKIDKLLRALRETKALRFGGPLPKGVVYEVAFVSATGSTRRFRFEPPGPRGIAGPPDGQIRGDEGGRTFLAESRLPIDLPVDPRALAPMAGRTLFLQKVIVRKGKITREATSVDGGSTWSAGGASAQQPVGALLGWLFKGEGAGLLPGERLAAVGFRTSEPVVSIDLVEKGGTTHRVDLFRGKKEVGAAWYRARPNASIYAVDRFRGLVEAADGVLALPESR
jgi:hypothetical protein